MTRKPNQKTPDTSKFRRPRERHQPYATESEEYRFDHVKPPTHPDQRSIHKRSNETPRRSNQESALRDRPVKPKALP